MRIQDNKAVLVLWGYITHMPALHSSDFHILHLNDLYTVISAGRYMHTGYVYEYMNA